MRTKDITVFPKGVNTFLFCAIPGAAGNLVCTGVRIATDTLLEVLAITHTNGIPSAVADVTAEFTISADNQINNTGGTSTANLLVMVLVARDVTT